MSRVPLLQVDGVTLQYKTRKPSSRDYRVDSRSTAPTATWVLGRAGCGKSTAQAVGGYSPDEGRITLDGREIVRRVQTG